MDVCNIVCTIFSERCIYVYIISGTQYVLFYYVAHTGVYLYIYIYNIYI